LVLLTDEKIKNARRRPALGGSSTKTVIHLTLKNDAKKTINDIVKRGDDIKDGWTVLGYWKISKKQKKKTQTGRGKGREI